MEKSDKNIHSMHESYDEVITDYREIHNRISPIAPVKVTYNELSLAFSVLFSRIFLSDRPNYEIGKGVYGATRSNWTYHTAMAIAQTCKVLNLTCKFEALGRRDAIIESKDEEPVVVLVAEWEWDCEDIFGKGKELDKLQKSCKTYKAADAFLLVYCSNLNYPDFLQRVTEYWVNVNKRDKNPPMLFLHTIIYQEKGSLREFERIAQVDIVPDDINIWGELTFKQN